MAEQDICQEIKCPQCQRVAPFVVFHSGGRLVIRYRCKRCRVIVRVREGLSLTVVDEQKGLPSD